MTEKTINNFAKAFIAAQSEMGNATKDSNNPFFKSKYADLNSVREACLPALNAHGIAVLQPIVQIDGKNFVKTLLLHESGESMEGLTEIIYSKQNDAQAQGSGITYARRYGLQSLVNIGAEDDDGNKASEKPKGNDRGFMKEKPSNSIADDQGMQELKSQKKETSLADKKKKAEDFFAKTKIQLELCENLEQVQALEKENQVAINGLNKPEYGSLYSTLLEAIDYVKLGFAGE